MSWPRPAPPRCPPPSQVPKELHTKMRGYYDHKYPDEKVINSAVVLEDLPPPLQAEMALFMHREVIKVCPLLRNAPRAVSASIVRHGKLTSGAVGDVLTRAGESPRDIYFMKNGTCDVFMMENSSEQTVDGHYKTVKVDQVQTGDIFGDMAVLQMAASNITITCTTDVEFLIVPRQDFLNALSDHPEARAAQARPWPAGSN